MLHAFLRARTVLAAVAGLAATLVVMGPASATERSAVIPADQGPHHHPHHALLQPAWAYDTSLTDGQVTFYREISPSGFIRLCVANEHAPGEIVGTDMQTKLNYTGFFDDRGSMPSAGNIFCTQFHSEPSALVFVYRSAQKNIHYGESIDSDGVVGRWYLGTDTGGNWYVGPAA